MRAKLATAGAVAGIISLAAGPLTANAAATTVVTPTNQQGWTTQSPTADTRPGGAANFVSDLSAPAGHGALRLTTDATTAAKVQYMHAANVPLADVHELSYAAKQNSASFNGGDPSYQLPVYLNGTSGFTTLVYEPYQNGTVTPGSWQHWDVASGQFWSTRSVTCSNGSVTAGGGGAPFYTLSQLQWMCPDAVVLGYGLNAGSNNPGYDVEADAFDFNGTVYDFEPTLSPTDKNSCKNDGWKTFNTPAFKNQGDCVSYVATGGRH